MRLRGDNCRRWRQGYNSGDGWEEAGLDIMVEVVRKFEKSRGRKQGRDILGYIGNSGF